MLQLFGLILLAAALLAIGAQLALQIAWSRRDRFWRHHDHLIPTAPRSYRAAR